MAHHRKIDIQSAQDMHYLERNITRAARRKIDLHFPPSAAPKEEEEEEEEEEERGAGGDGFRARVEGSVGEVCLSFFIFLKRERRGGGWNLNLNWNWNWNFEGALGFGWAMGDGRLANESDHGWGAIVHQANAHVRETQHHHQRSRRLSSARPPFY